jgi:AbiTii
MATSSLVIDLQRAALDEGQSVSSLLRKAKVVATKLDLAEALTWIDAELSGYESERTVPDYRQVRASVEMFNPYLGWQKVQFANSALRDVFSNRALSAGVPLLEEYSDRARTESGGRLSVATPQAGIDLIHSQMPVKLRVESFVDLSMCKHITAAVRARILDWALGLEKKGVLGTGMTFSEKERHQASTAPQINIGSIGNLAGSIGGIVGEQNVDATQTIIEGFNQRALVSLDKIEESLRGLPEDETKDLLEAVSVARTAAQGEKVDESQLKGFLRKIPAAAVSLSNYAAQAFVTAEIGKLVTGN